MVGTDLIDYMFDVSHKRRVHAAGNVGIGQRYQSDRSIFASAAAVVALSGVACSAQRVDRVWMPFVGDLAVRSIVSSCAKRCEIIGADTERHNKRPQPPQIN